MADACEASGTAQAVERGLTTCFAKLMKKLALIVASLAGMAGGACAQGQFSAQAGILNSNALHSHARQTNNLEDPFSDAGSTAAAYSFARGELSQDLSTPGGSPSGAEFFDAALPRPAAWEDHSTAFEAAPDENAVDSLAPVDFSDGSFRRLFRDSDFRAWNYDSVYAKAVTNEWNGNWVVVQTTPWRDDAGGNSGSGPGKAVVSVGGAEPSEQQVSDDFLYQPPTLIFRQIASPEPNTVALALIGGLLVGWRLFARTRGSPAKSRA